MLTLLGIGTALAVVAGFCDRFLCRERKEKKEYLDALRANYQDMLETAEKFPRDQRMKSLVALAGSHYYRESIDGTIKIDAANIESFVRQVCDLDQKDETDTPFMVQLPKVVMEKAAAKRNEYKKGA